MGKRGSIWLAALALAAAGPACAQDVPVGDGARAEAMIIAARPAVAAPRRQRCDAPAAAGEITVCGAGNAQFRAQSTAESDPNSRQATSNGVPRAPELGRRSCRGTFGCLVGGGVTPPPYIIDLKAIAESPAGSDAEKVANGQMSDR